MSNRLPAFRHEYRLTQAALAERLGVSRQTVNSIGTERYEPSLGLALRIAREFGVPVEAIFALHD